ncbi:MAG: hypothetical protein RLZ63_2283 [Pseudomonadota bacterium]|jgi:hypothetical protein
MGKDTPLVSAEELDALIKGWGPVGHSVDRFFPVRFWILITVAAIYTYLTLFDADRMASRVASDPVEITRIANYLYFRGWFLLGATAVLIYAYAKNWYLGIMSLCTFIIGVANLLSDIFNIYWDVLASPTPAFTVMLLVRVTALWLVFINLRHASSLPDGVDRFNILLPFRKAT